MSTLELFSGNCQTALTIIEKGLALLRSGPSWLRVGALINLGMVYRAQGEMERAVEAALDALTMSQQLHDHYRTVAIYNNLGNYRSVSGDWIGAFVAYKEGLAIAERIGIITFQVPLALNLGTLSIRQGNYEFALENLLKGLEAARSHRLTQYEIAIQSSLADLYLRQEEWEAAEQALVQAQELANQMDEQEDLPGIYRGWAHRYLSVGECQGAFHYAEKAVDMARELRMSLEEGSSRRVLGQALLANNQPQAALEAFSQSLALLEHRDPYEAARTQAEWGHALLPGPETERGITLLQEARATFERLGAQRDLAAVEGILGTQNVKGE
jgi:tetratricopeptide (TPR) repeat protein